MCYFADDAGTYSDPNYEDYSSRQLMTIRQIPASGATDLTDDIDLTPAPPINDYSNIGPNGEVLDEPVRKKPHPPKKPPRPPEMMMMNGSELYDDADSLPMTKPPPLPKPSELKRRSHDPTAAKVGGAQQQEDLYGNREVEMVLAMREGRGRLSSGNEYEDAEALDKMLAPPPVKSFTPAGTYDNPDEIIGSFNRGGENVYDTAETNEAELYDDVAPKDQRFQTPLSPKFDDVIYMKQGETPPAPSSAPSQKPPLMKKPPTTRKPPAFKNMSESTVSGLSFLTHVLPRVHWYYLVVGAYIVS